MKESIGRHGRSQPTAWASPGRQVTPGLSVPTGSIGAMARTRAKPKPTTRATVTDADLRAEVASWARADLEEFALDMLRENRGAHEAVARQVVAKRGSAAAVAVFVKQIDAALDVGLLNWKEIRDYSRRLDGIVADVRKLGKADPRSACEVARYFLARLPAVFECVDAENEIADVCEELAEILLALARPSGAGLMAVAGDLLDRFEADNYGNMGRFPELVSAAPRSKAERLEIQALLHERARARPEGFRGRKLGEAARSVGARRRSRRSP